MNAMPRAAILGVTGFIGRGLPALLGEQGLACTGVSRAGGGSVPGVAVWQTPDALDFTGHQVVINLSGESIARRWTTANRRLFYDSRVGVTRRVVEAIGRLPEEARPQVLINASAVGIYGNRGDEVLTEESATGHGYLAELCVAWEESAREAEALGVRVVCLRSGLVLGREGAAWRKLVRVFKAGLGGSLGTGRQWMPWIHLADHRAAIVHAVCSGALAGAVNCTAPAADRNRNFTYKLATALHRPAILPVPGWVLRLALGGFGAELLAGQHARPAALEADHFTFRFPTLESALDDLIG
jgi:uncharacterized protein (TIGR01777 family)